MTLKPERTIVVTAKGQEGDKFDQALEEKLNNALDKVGATVIGKIVILSTKTATETITIHNSYQDIQMDSSLNLTSEQTVTVKIASFLVTYR